MGRNYNKSMSRWAIGFGLLVLITGWTAGPATAQDSTQESTSPFGLPPPYKPPVETPKADAPAGKTEKKEAAVDKSELPPEEDKSDAPKEFTFNPVQSQKQILAGDYYFKKGNYVAAASRYDEATKWNDGNAEAWLRLGEAQEKKSNARGARTAYEKFLELSPDAKNSADVKKRLAKLKP